MARTDTQKNLKRKRKINATMLRDAKKSAAKDSINLRIRTDIEGFFKAKKKA
jgi:hypothetical protein